MKQTLLEKIESIRKRLCERVNQLELHVEGYKNADNYEDAMKCHIKMTTLKMVLNDIEDALK